MKEQTIDFMALYQDCRLCPRECGVNRSGSGTEGRAGFCKETSQLRVSYVGPHFGEEPPLTGTHGSGTIFFSGCSLRCSFCQNYQISRDGLGWPVDLDELVQRVEQMIRDHRVHNINLVTPDHFFPHAFRLISLLRRKGYSLPAVFNFSGYQSVPILKHAEPYADIYLPDFKYADPALAARFSRCRDYPDLALRAIAEMIRQKGFLDSFERSTPSANRGVMVRHLILPGYVENSVNALTTLFLEFGALLPLSLMSQYSPVLAHKEENMNRTLRAEEFQAVYAHALDLGFHRLFVQFPDEKGPGTKPPFLPDFRLSQPFSTSPE
jgi:putative pyruvate formate lyase activating enzyme